jgi:hypothetical protein
MLFTKCEASLEALFLEGTKFMWSFYANFLPKNTGVFN